MKRSKFLKTIGGGLLALPAIPVIANNNKELTMTDTDTPTFTDAQLRHAKTRSHDELSNLINDIIEITGGKINGHPIYRTPVPVFVDENGNIKSAETFWLSTFNTYDLFDNIDQYNIDDLKDYLNHMLKKDKDMRNLLVHKLIDDLKLIVNKPMYFYELHQTPSLTDPNDFIDKFKILIRMT